KIAIAGAMFFAAALGATTWIRVPTNFKPKRAFYYWRTEWSPSTELLASLDKNEIRRLYIRFFDVEWDELEKAPRPVSPLTLRAPLPRQVEIVPVVYIVNSVFLKLPYADVEDLADKVWRKVSRMAAENGIAFQQFQIDCDWSDTTRRSYFHFAELLRLKLHRERKIVSSTIRLHQIKYAERTGIPPVSRGMLMFYNFGRIQADSPKSSIFNSEDASRYASFISGYPMPLDLVLPMFSWSVHSRDGRVLGLLEKLDAADFVASAGFQQVSANRYAATRSFFFHGQYFMRGDFVVMERTT